MEVRRQLVSVEPSIQTVQKGGIVVIDSPRIELQEADGFFNVQLREVVDGCLGNPFITNGVIDIAIGYQGQELFLSVFLYFLYIDGITDFIAQML